MRPLKAHMVGHDDLPTQRANQFDRNIYRLLVKARYKQEDVVKLVQKPSELTNITTQKSTKVQKVWLKKTNSTKATDLDLSFLR